MSGSNASILAVSAVSSAIQIDLAGGTGAGFVPPIGPANDATSIGGRVLHPNATLVTYYISDTQFEYLGARGFTHNPLIKWFLEPADRNVILTQTAPLWVDELLHHVKQDYKNHAQAIEVKGDIGDTPLRSEVKRLETILNRHDVPVEGYTRGNHSSGNIFGVINLASPWYAKRQDACFLRFHLDDQLEGAAEEPGDILTQQATMEAMHRIVTGCRDDKPGPKRLTTAVHEADYEGYQLLPHNDQPEEHVPFTPENLERNFQTFWKPTKGTQTGLTRETRFWECIVNYDIADAKQKMRGTKVNPIYLQASETARFRADDGTEHPVYTLSLDNLDHNNLVAALGAGVSEFQVRLLETFMERMLRENPRARFKISSHFSAKDLVDVPWYMPWRRRRSKKAREAFRRLLAREEVVLFSYGHTHSRKVTDLNRDLKLGRKSPLTEINVPSLIDYHPNQLRHNGEYHDARALVVEKLRFLEDPQKGRRLVIDLEYRGLDAKDIQAGRTPRVEAALKEFGKNHGYNRARETVKKLRYQHILGWAYSHAKRFAEFIWHGFFQLSLLRGKAWRKYWRDLSVVQYLIDNFTVASTVNMFNEARHLVPFLESVAKFIGEKDEPGQLAVRAQLLGIRTALLENAYVRQNEFEAALASGRRPSDLKVYNDLFLRTRAHRIADLLMRLKVGSEARAFAILASIQASKEEFQSRRFLFFRAKPTRVPNQVPPIEIPLPGVSSQSAASGGN
ncbi:MAG TPA: hypothetical protein VLJ37_00110 [bacterium]|nr:hypothetical protein [bacterium]